MQILSSDRHSILHLSFFFKVANRLGKIVRLDVTYILKQAVGDSKHPQFEQWHLYIANLQTKNLILVRIIDRRIYTSMVRIKNILTTVAPFQLPFYDPQNRNQICHHERMNYGSPQSKNVDNVTSESQFRQVWKLVFPLDTIPIIHKRNVWKTRNTECWKCACDLNVDLLIKENYEQEKKNVSIMPITLLR